MTEEQWLNGNDQTPMLEFLRGKASDRKLRLFACACCRRIGHVLSDERCRTAAKAVEVAESFADGMTSAASLAAAREAAQSVFTTHFGTLWLAWGGEAAAMAAAADIRVKRTRHGCRYEGGGLGEAAAAAAKAAAGYAADGPHAEGLPKAIVESTYEAVRTSERQQQARLLHCVFGNPFRPSPSLPSATLAWNDGTVRRLAQAIYEDRAFDRMPILADALEDAGCTEPYILDHCRQPEEHVRGCWVVDLILGKD
jgi:hypothetical protein